ncbi:hypothetical protein ACFZB5_26930 [Streptomyces nodosus]|uniref:hypothetical protein n=1 Tax=Streptomyces nodosus TaxID=40318 RepID=UPI0036E78677
MRVNPFKVLAASAADWSRYEHLLDPAAWERLSERLAELRIPGADRDAAADRAARTLLEALPGDAAVGLRQDADPGRFVGPPSTVLHEGYGAADLCMLVLDGNPMVGPVLGLVRERLLREPALPWSEATDPQLIVLSGEDGRRLVPLFQFEAGTMPWQVVLDINAELSADLDPWGAADWWLSRTTWWDATPAALLGRGRDAELRGAAHALVAIDGEA